MREYEVEISGIKHTVQLSDEDAKARGLSASDQVKPAVAKQPPAPANKARAAKDKA